MAEIAEQVLVINDTHYGPRRGRAVTICHLICYAFMEIPRLPTREARGRQEIIPFRAVQRRRIAPSQKKK